MNRPGVHGGAGLAPAVGLIRSLSAFVGVTHHRPAARFPCSRPASPDPTSRVGGSVGMLADEVDYVVGVDTHRDQHVLAVVVAPTGAVVAQTIGARRPRAATRTRSRFAERSRAAASRLGGRGRRPLRRRARPSPERPRRDGARGRPHRRGERRLHGKDDPLDAIRAARSALASADARRCRARASARRRCGVLLLARRSAVDVRRRRARPAPQRDRDRARELRQRAAAAARRRAAPTLQPLPPLERTHTRRSSRPSSCCAHSPAASRPRPTRPTNSNARSSPTSARSCRKLLDEPGVGPIVAAQLIVTWSHHDRVRSEAAFARLAGVAPLPASSGHTTRHRLSRGGDRQLNRALHTVILHRRQHDPATKRLHRPPRRRRQKQPRRRPASSSATSPATSTASCRTRAHS